MASKNPDFTITQGLASHKPKTKTTASQYDVDNEFLSYPGCSKTPPGQELYAAYNKIAFKAQYESANLFRPFNPHQKRQYLDSDDDVNDDEAENEHFHRNISDNKSSQSMKIQRISSHDQNIGAKNIPERKYKPYSRGTKHLPEMKSEMLMPCALQEPTIPKQAQVSERSALKPKTACSDSLEYMPIKEEKLYSKNKPLKVYQVPEKDPKTGCMNDKTISAKESMVISFYGTDQKRKNRRKRKVRKEEPKIRNKQDDPYDVQCLQEAMDFLEKDLMENILN